MKIVLIILSVWQTICGQLCLGSTVNRSHYGHTNQLRGLVQINGAILKNMSEANHNTAQWARDGNLAIIEEFAHLERQNTIGAMELFIARHPDHPLVEKAQQIIQRLEARKLK